MKRFTDLGIRNLRPKKTRIAKTEGDGLFIRVTPSGQKKWYRMDETATGRVWTFIGDYSEQLDVLAARIKNQELARLRTLENTHATLTYNSSLRELFDDWHSRAVGRKNKPWSEAHKKNVRYMFEADVLPTLGDKRILDLRKADVRALLRKVEQRAPGQALQLYRRLQRLFNYAAEEDVIEVNPIANLPQIGHSEPKDRTLTYAEIRTFIDHLPESYMDSRTAVALELILRLGQRPGEIVGMTSSEVDTGSLLWTIPGNRTKNDKQQVIPLTRKIISLLGEANKYGLYFPSPKHPDQSMPPTALSNALRRSLTGKGKRLKDDAVTIPVKAPFTPHDLRRTFATGLRSLGFSPDVIAACLNHRPRTVTDQHYVWHDFQVEKRKAVLAWEKEVDTAGRGKVVSLKEVK